TITDGVTFATATLTIDVTPDMPPIGPNVIIGEPNQPRIDGTDAADIILIGRSRATQVFGGDDADIFVFGQTANDGFRDVAYIRDFEQGIDAIDLSGNAFSLRTLGLTSVITLDTPDRDTLFVTGVTLTAADFTDEWTNSDPGLLA
ncbi:M10 family metallopeptidase C-terminal domain-containing protein, partial [Rubrimonas sp.]|uniref:M10 family metallopeptidase C-terminal domain-containing protein n=1 Tax=Rubrimonas sp. TaxID=2036015 RepID=UPI003FA6A234